MPSILAMNNALEVEGANCNTTLREAFRIETSDFVAYGFTNEDCLKCYLTLEKISQSNPIGRHSLIDALKEHIPERYLIPGVLEELVRALNQNKTKILGPRKIAQGIAAVPGIPERIELLTRPFQVKDENEHSGLSRKLSFQNISKGKIVARLYPATPGVAGETAFGVPIKADKGHSGLIRLDSSIRAKPASEVEFVELESLDQGYLLRNEQELRVVRTLMINEDLDHSYGDLDFVGFVDIKGDVMQGISVKADCGIHIAGSFRGNNLNSPSGSIYIAEHAFGGHSGSIVAAGTLTATVVQEVNTEVIGNIIIRREAFNSKLRSASSILMPDGILVGGEAFAFRGVEAKTIGSEAGIKTIIRLSSDLEASMEYSKLNVELEVLDRERMHLAFRLGPFAQNRSLLLNLPPQQRNKLKDFTEQLRSLELRRTLVKEQLESLKSRAKRATELRVSFHDILHEGVQIFCGNECFKPTSLIQGPATIEFVLGRRQFVLRDFVPLI